MITFAGRQLGATLASLGRPIGARLTTIVAYVNYYSSLISASGRGKAAGEKNDDHKHDDDDNDDDQQPGDNSICLIAWRTQTRLIRAI